MLEGTFTINSSIDNASGLLSKYVYDNTKTNLPVVILMHGYNLTIDAIEREIMVRIANQGFFVAAIGMRGRKGASGKRDASAKELYDIYDGINHIKENFPVSDKVIVSGYSGGGGNVLGFAVKFPYVASTIVNHFGMVDYGYDDVESWYARTSGYRAGIENFVGHPRVPENMNYYRSRNAHEALKNAQAKIYSFHDTGDNSVRVELTNYLTDGLEALDKNHETHISTSSDSIRYLHNMGASEKTEGYWLPYGKTAIKPTMNLTGNFRVIGYVVTDEFSIFLGGLDDNVADIDYNLSENKFTVQPLTGNMPITILKNGLQQTKQIDGVTTFNFEGGEIEPPEPSAGGKIKNYYIKQGLSYQKVNNIYTKKEGRWQLTK